MNPPKPLPADFLAQVLAGKNQGALILHYGVDREVVRRWLSEPGIMQARWELTQEPMRKARRAARDVAEKIPGVYLEILQDSDAPPMARLKAGERLERLIGLDKAEARQIDPPPAPTTPLEEATQRRDRIAVALIRAEDNPAAMAALSSQLATADQDVLRAQEAAKKPSGVSDGLERVVEMLLAAPPAVMDALIGKLVEARDARMSPKS